MKLNDQVITQNTARVKEGKRKKRICFIKGTHSNVACKQHHVATRNLVSPEVL